MPTYDLTCRECGHRYERFVPRMIRDDDRVCPVCDAREMKVGIGGGVLATGGGSGRTPSPSSSCGTSAFG
jgi:putative FmdB family regulatory protein